MKFILVAMFLYAVECATLPFISAQWEFLLFTKYLAVSLLVSGVYAICRNESLLIRSVLALWLLLAWADVINIALWNYLDRSVDLSSLIGLVFAGWLLFVLRRRFDSIPLTYNKNNILLLIKRPDSYTEVIKGLFGAPVASLCVSVYGKVWAFRKKTGAFELFDMNDKFLSKHAILDTGVASNLQTVQMLTDLVGTPRGLGYKCIWVIRDPLNSIGGKYSIKSWFDYIPGFYAMRILP